MTPKPPPKFFWNLQNEIIMILTNLNPKYTFDTFIVGDSNDIMYRTAQSIADNPIGIYNPLLICGDIGYGKTHLIQAMANKIIAEKPNLNIIVYTCEQFVNEIADAMFLCGKLNTQNKIYNLRQYFKTADVLIMNDLQQFSVFKKVFQKEFFHILNELVSKHKQIVISATRHPKEIVELEDNLCSLFEMGFLLEIQPPDNETKIEILNSLAIEQKCVVPY